MPVLAGQRGFQGITGPYWAAVTGVVVAEESGAANFGFGDGADLWGQFGGPTLACSLLSSHVLLRAKRRGKVVLKAGSAETPRASTIQVRFNAEQA